VELRPTFVLSLDTELIWGSFDFASPDEFESSYPALRETIAVILTALEDYEIAATWAVVGHLFLDACARGADGRAHPGLPRPNLSWYPQDWFGKDPCSDRSHDPLWYGDDIVDSLVRSRVEQEIGCHSFAHVPFGDPGCPAELVHADLVECIKLAAERGLSLQSFVFPRNSEGHHAILREHGFIAYRGLDPTWFEPLPGQARRAARLIDYAVPIPPPVSRPVETQPGLWNVPGSMLLIGRRGARRLVPLASPVAKAKAGLGRAVRENKVFHLWLHPFNLANDRENMIGAFREILAEAVRLRDAGSLDIRTMGDLATHLSA
jgi:peptidoglycan/xylan/chitin deacetylase (PgdA/CDA1 family)